jgi:hypothetical protein
VRWCGLLVHTVTLHKHWLVVHMALVAVLLHSLLLCRSTWVRWCGLLVHTVTLELMADYSRYSGQHIASSLTLNRDGRPGQLLCSKLLSYMRPKMHGLLLDTSINSPATVRLNIYQVRSRNMHQPETLMHICGWTPASTAPPQCDRIYAR